jgi:putative endonuclease
MIYRQLAGQTAHRAGLAAEDGVLRHYLRAGLQIVARRWRGGGGEIDLIARGADGYVFVEVKASHDFARAAERVTQRQADRICAAAQVFLGGVAGGLGNAMRIDVALVDRFGRIQVCENAIFGA